jgi:hypothetical protein
MVRLLTAVDLGATGHIAAVTVGSTDGGGRVRHPIVVVLISDGVEALAELAHFGNRPLSSRWRRRCHRLLHKQGHL